VGAEGLFRLECEGFDFFLWVGLAPSGWNFSRMAAVRVCQGVFHARSSDWTMAVTLPRSVSGLRWSPSMERGGEEPHRCRRSAETLRMRGGWCSRERLGWRRWVASSLHALPVVAQRAGTGWGPMENRNWNSPRWAGEKTS
jgi:hypothetical protein